MKPTFHVTGNKNYLHTFSNISWCLPLPHWLLVYNLFLSYIKVWPTWHLFVLLFYLHVGYELFIKQHAKQTLFSVSNLNNLKLTLLILFSSHVYEQHLFFFHYSSCFLLLLILKFVMLSFSAHTYSASSVTICEMTQSWYWLEWAILFSTYTW